MEDRDLDSISPFEEEKHSELLSDGVLEDDLEIKEDLENLPV